MCSVVPDVLASLCETIRRYFHQEPLVVTLHLDLGIEVRYSPRTGVGADRLANAVAAIHLYGAPAVVVDFGTGTNFDVVSEDRAYIGGAIAPGLEIAEEALYAHAAQLTRVPLEPPPAAIGNNTTAAVQSGLLYGYAGLVDGLVARFCQELGRPAHVIATGGLAEIVAPYARSVQHVDPDLTLVGLQLIYSRNAPYAGSARTRQG
jgi:type III pantothenate kinase